MGDENFLTVRNDLDMERALIAEYLASRGYTKTLAHFGSVSPVAAAERGATRLEALVASAVKTASSASDQTTAGADFCPSARTH